jgi:phenylacetate-coenzyme A ligase PaaK-like adenylate-forming protein
MRAAGISPADIRSLDDYIRRFPKVTTAEYRARQHAGNLRDLIDRRMRLESLVEDRSSGSSGVTISVFRSRAEHTQNQARALRYLIKAGVRPWHRALAVIPPLQRRDRSSILGSFADSRRTTVDYTMQIESVVDIIRRKRINVIYGQKSFIRLVGEHFASHGIDPPRLAVLNVGAEHVDAYDRAYLQKLFKPARFSEFYGATEPYLIAARFGKDYEVDYGAVFFSLDDAEESCGLTKGEVLVTSLINQAQPILKLELGDRVAVRHYHQLCNLGATIAKVEGRSNDFLHLPDGGRISGATFYASLEYFPFMRQFKIVQDGEDQCRIMLSLAAQSAENRARVEEVLAHLLGGRIQYRIEYVEHIPIEPNGKHKILSSNVGSPRQRS